MYFFFRLNSSNCFPVKTHVFRMSFNFFLLFVYDDGALKLHLHVIDLLCHDQPRLHNS